MSQICKHTKTNIINLIVLVLLAFNLLLSSRQSLLVSRCMSQIQQIDSMESCVPRSTIEEEPNLRYSTRPVQYMGNTSFTTTKCYYYLHSLTEDLQPLTVASVKLRCMVSFFFLIFLHSEIILNRGACL